MAPDGESVEELVTKHFAWAMAKASPFQRRWPHLADEIASAAAMGLFQAAQRYDESRGCQFRSYAKARVAGEILDELARHTCPLRRHALADVADGLIDGRDPVAEAVEEEDFEALLNTVRARLRPLLRLIFGADMTVSEAARTLGISVALASKWHRIALADLGAPERGPNLRAYRDAG